MRQNNKYDTIKIPEGITLMCDELIDKFKYTSRTDVIKTAVRNLYREHEAN